MCAFDEGIVPGVRIEPFLYDLQLRGAAMTSETRTEVARALMSLDLAVCVVCSGPRRAWSTSVRMSVLPQPAGGRMRAIFYGLCSACSRRADVDACAAANIAADPHFGAVAEVASMPFSVVERGEFLDQFSGPLREFFHERIAFPEKYGFNLCTRCRSQPAVFFRFFYGGPEADGARTLYFCSMCCECALDGRVPMEAAAQLHIAARDPQSTGRPS